VATGRLSPLSARLGAVPNRQATGECAGSGASFFYEVESDLMNCAGARVSGVSVHEL